MTCVVALPNGRTVVFAADSMLHDPNADMVFTDPRKVLVVDVDDEKVGFAAAGDSSLLSLVRTQLDLPAVPKPGDEDHWAQVVAEAMTDMARDHRILDKDKKMDGFVLLALRGRLWSLYDYHAMRIDEPTAIGCGGAYAVGALAALGSRGTRKQRARRAVEIACRYNPFCRPPVVVTEI